MTQLTLSPNNQIALLSAVDNLVVGTEYVIAAEFLRSDTRFVFKGRTDIALTRRPAGVPARHTMVEAQINPVPPPAPVQLTTTTIYPYQTKNRLDAAGLNSSFLPYTGGTITGALSIETGGLTVGGDIRLTVPTHPDKTISYITRHSQLAGFRRLGITGSDPALVYYPLEELWINATATTITGTVSTGSAIDIGSGGLSVNGDIRIETPTHPDHSIAYITRHNQGAGFRRLGITGSDPALVYYPLEELWINATRTTLTGAANISGALSVAGATTVSGALTVGDIHAGALTATTLVTTGAATVGGLLTANAGIGVTGGNVNISGGYGLTIVGAGGLTANTVIATGPGPGNISIHATSGGIQSDQSGTALYLPNGNVVCQSVTAASAGGLGGGISIYATNGGFRSDFSGTALYLPNGNVVCQGIEAAATMHCSGGLTVDGDILVNGANASVGHLVMRNGADITGAVAFNGGLDVYAGVSTFHTQAVFQGYTDVNGTLRAFGGINTGTILIPNSTAAIYCGTPGYSWLSVSSYGYLTTTMMAASLATPVPPHCLPVVLAVEPKAYAQDRQMQWGFLPADIAGAMERAGYDFGGVRAVEGVEALDYGALLACLWSAVRELASQLSELQFKSGDVNA